MCPLQQAGFDAIPPAFPSAAPSLICNISSFTIYSCLEAFDLHSRSRIQNITFAAEKNVPSVAATKPPLLSISGSSPA